MDELRRKPSRWYYALAALVFVGGCGVFVLLMARQVNTLSGSLTQILAPGETELNLSAPGTYIIFYERESTLGGRVYSTGEHLSGLECQLISRATGSGVALSAPRTSSSYAIGGRSGRSFLQFQVAQPGIYALSAKYTGGQMEPEVVLAVGQEFSRHTFAVTLGALVIMSGSVGIALAIAVMTAIKRKARQRSPLGTAG
jgi:hypothetical protein